MATTLSFTKKGIWNVCQLNPAVPVTVQMQLAKKGIIDVKQFIDDMPPVTVFSTDAYDNIIFQVDVPEGVTVELACTSEVTKALMI